VSPRKEHIDLLYAAIAPITSCCVITGTTKDRKGVFQEVLEGKHRVTIATTSIMSEGASNPRWHHVISTMPFSDPKTAIQLSGRCIRKMDGKTQGYFWDVIDVNPMCKSMYKQRWRTLKKFLGGHRVHYLSGLPPYLVSTVRPS
jgi:superfamily II DNA or RNA helicase